MQTPGSARKEPRTPSVQLFNIMDDLDRNWEIKDATHRGDRKNVNQVDNCGMERKNILII
jgi:hypothetical protein